METREQTIQVMGLKIRVVSQGHGPAVLMIHGVGGWAENFKGLMARVAASGYRAIAFDLPGFGQSEPPADGTRYFDGEQPFYVEFVRALLDVLELRTVTIVGHSLGGAICSVFGASHPERVSRIVLLAPAGFGDAVAWRLRLLALPLCEQLAPHVPTQVVTDMVRSNFAEPDDAPLWLCDDALRYAPTAGREMSRVLRQVLSARGQCESLRAEWCEKFALLRRSTLVLWGARDRTLPAAQATRVKQLLPHACVEILPKAGHMLMLEAEERVAQSVLTFLWTTERRRPGWIEPPWAAFSSKAAAPRRSTRRMQTDKARRCRKRAGRTHPSA